MSIVELKSVRKEYGAFTAVDSISLRTAEGEFLALLGPSGCGKTTTLNLLAGFIAPTAGEILVDGTNIASVPPHRRNIGVVFQSYALFPHLSVFDNVAFGLRMRKVPPADIAVRVRRALDLVRLGSLEERFSRQLSGGQQQRAALARALVIEPSLLLLDEPLSNLDASLREQMRFEIREIQKRIGITTLFVTHDQSEAMAAADRLVIMEKGAIRQVGTVREIYEHPADTFVAGFIGQANLLPGVVVGRNDGWVSMRLQDGSVVDAPDRGGSHDEGTLVVRPEDIVLADAPVSGANNLKAEVSRVSFLGATINVGVVSNGVSLSLLTPRRGIAPTEGSTVWISWPREGTLAFL